MLGTHPDSQRIVPDYAPPAPGTRASAEDDRLRGHGSRVREHCDLCHPAHRRRPWGTERSVVPVVTPSLSATLVNPYGQDEQCRIAVTENAVVVP